MPAPPPGLPYADVWTLLEANHAELLQAVLEHMANTPALQPVLRALGDLSDPAVLAEVQRSQGLVRAALVDGDFAPYQANMRLEGRRYARQGMSIRDWWGLLGPYRRVLIPAAAATLPPERLTSVLLALEAFVDLAMREVGDAYHEESLTMVREAEGQRDLYATLFEACPLGLAIHRVDEAGQRTIIESNPAAVGIRQSLGLTEAERAAISVAFDEEVRAVLGTGEPRESQLEHGPHVVRRLVMRLDQRHVGLILEDVTEKARVHRTLVRTVADLERSNRDLDQFAYVASHDLRSPMRDIQNLAAWITEDLGDDLPEASARHLLRLRSRMARMENLLEDLLEYSRAGRTSTRAEPFSLEVATASAVGAVSVPQGFRVAVEGLPLTVHTPRPPLELILRNLIGNAVKHHDRVEGTITVRWGERGRFVEVEVADDGPGIPPQFHARVFEMFQTLRPRDAVEGSGMGLAVVRRVVEAYGGQVAVESAGRGTIARFTWPLRWEGSIS